MSLSIDSLTRTCGAFLSLLSLCFEFLTALQSIDNKMGKLASLLAAGCQIMGSSIPFTWSQWVTGCMYVAYSSEPRVTLCTPWFGATGHFVHTLLLHHQIPILTTTSHACAAHPTANLLVCSAWCLWGLVGDVNWLQKWAITEIHLLSI